MDVLHHMVITGIICSVLNGHVLYLYIVAPRFATKQPCPVETPGIDLFVSKPFVLKIAEGVGRNIVCKPSK